MVKTAAIAAVVALVVTAVVFRVAPIKSAVTGLKDAS